MSAAARPSAALTGLALALLGRDAVLLGVAFRPGSREQDNPGGTMEGRIAGAIGTLGAALLRWRAQSRKREAKAGPAKREDPSA